MYRTLQKRLTFFVVMVIVVSFYLSGYYEYIRELSFDEFSYPLEEDISLYVEEMKNGKKPSKTPINEYKFSYLTFPVNKCYKGTNLELVYVIKSGLDHFERREAIRRSWGDNRRFPGKGLRRFFMVGVREDASLQEKINEESEKYEDIIQANFLDTYYNNTIKTMMSFKWLVKNCPDSNFYMFVDDDYFVSMKNVLSYIQNPIEYPKLLPKPQTNRIKRFYSGNCIPSRPIRDFFSKYKLSLEEYPYDKFPLYSTAGAYILSTTALVELYYASHFMKHFRFDDVYLGILSRKINISPYHTKYIARGWDKSDRDFQRHCLASHGFEDIKKMLSLWTQQKNLGYA